jgi:hypothetical protein
MPRSFFPLGQLLIGGRTASQTSGKRHYRKCLTFSVRHQIPQGRMVDELFVEFLCVRVGDVAESPSKRPQLRSIVFPSVFNNRVPHFCFVYLVEHAAAFSMAV